MNKLILQPAGDPVANLHYVGTVENPVDLKTISNMVSPETLKRLEALYPKGKVPVWGVTSGKKGVNYKKWEKVASGDIAIFSRHNKIFASGVVAFKIHDKNLALKLWKKDASGETWEFIYFLDEIKKLNVTYKEFNSIVGYKDNYVIQGFNVLDESKSEKFINHLNLRSDTYFPEVTVDEYKKSVDVDLDKPLDKTGITKARTEQSFLRNYLFGGRKIEKCGICGNDFPVGFLVASHIKKRSLCSDAEKRDYKHIVMPMCKFGCDELFEKGYIVVNDGEVVKNSSKVSTKPIDLYVAGIERKKLENWNEGTKKYFLYHFEMNR